MLDPIPNFKYGLEIGGILVAGFTSCSGLEVSRDTVEVAEGGINDHVHVLPGPVGHGHVTFERGITFTSFLWEWMHWGMTDTEVLRLPVVIIFFDVSGLPVKIWPLLDAYPVKWAGQQVKSGSRDVAIETLEIAFGGRPQSSGGVQRALAGESAQPGSTGAVASEGRALADGELQRQLAQKVVKLLKDTMRIERERAGRFGGN